LFVFVRLGLSLRDSFSQLPLNYPVFDIVASLKEKLSTNSVVILQAPPGAGKSTILPLQLLDEPWLQGKKIIMLEPRRLAAKSVAERMADLLNENAGERIGYSVRFDSKTSSKTKVEVVTEGILTRMIQSDNTLEEVGLLIFDEFHERSLHADLALALSLQMQQVLRDDLRILIMSATLDSDNLSSILGNAPIVTSSGRQYPVTIHYTSEEDGPIVARMVNAMRRAIRDDEGDVLAFLPGAGEIKRAEEMLLADDYFSGISIHPLFGDLPFKQQQQAILPRTDDGRKIVLATSIAETSLTIEGVRVVIDAGLARVPRFDPRSGLTRLETIRVTRDAADQRAGRAGRLGPGVCYRLWSSSTQSALAAQRKPEILEADLAPLMLELYAWGVKDPKELTWITLPTMGAVAQAKELLAQLEAITPQGITARGKQMLGLPTHPRIAHLLLEASSAEKSLATDIAALIEEKDPLMKESGADLALRLEALRKWRGGQKFYADRMTLERIEKVAHQWRRLLKTEASNNMVADTAIGKLLVAAYPERIARQQEKHSERFKLANGRVVKLPPHDPLMRESWLCVAQLDAGAGEGKIFMAAAVAEKDLNSLAYEANSVSWDDERGLLVSAVEKRVGNLLLSTKSPGTVTDDDRVRVLCDAIRKHGLKMIGWGEAHVELQARMLTIKAWRKDEPWPDVSEQSLLATLEDWLAPFLTSISRRADLEKLDLNTILKSMIPWDLQNKFDTLVPPRIEVPSGSMIRLQYFSDARSPIIEVRLQEMFGLTETPAINEGRHKVLIHLLSPGYKPVQVTQDLKSFWQTTYHEVRKELRMRYPRHHWPEDPWTAEAVRGAKRRNS
jgi:ATP-dependent helicase HrpB